jgi:MFS transporter, DHA3 family, tetracycline resistance protein
VLFLLVTLLRNTSGPILSVWLTAATPSGSRATVFSIQAQADALGQIAGGPPAGAVGRRWTAGAGVAIGGVFLLPAVALFAYGVRRSPVAPLPSTTVGPPDRELHP